MRIRFALPVALLIASVATVGLSAQQATAPQKDMGKQDRFEMFKKLVGEWKGKELSGDHKGMEFAVKYKLTGGGSALVEVIFPGEAHEMVTVIHPDGKNLALTHYCMLGNQPHMKADAMGDGKSVAFQFTHASNLKDDKEMYMHDVTYTFVDNDTVKSEWTSFKNGKAAEKVVFELKRSKK